MEKRKKGLPSTGKSEYGLKISPKSAIISLRLGHREGSRQPLFSRLFPFPLFRKECSIYREK